MSPLRIQRLSTPSVQIVASRLAIELGSTVRSERIRRAWTLAHLAELTALSVSRVQSVETGIPASLETYARIAVALGLRPEFVFSDPRRRTKVMRSEDPVHAAMGERQAAHFRSLGFGVAIDEPYQHYQFAPAASTPSAPISLPVIAERLGLKDGFRSVTHVMVVLWSAEALHMLRIRTETFRSLCPDAPDAFEQWWAGRPPATGTHRTLVVFDPAADLGRRATFRGLDALSTLRPRYPGYREAAQALEREHRG